MDEINALDTDNSGKTVNRNETRLLKYTETIDKLVLQNKNLQKELSDSEAEIDGLNDKLQESNVRISKNLFYVGLAIACFLIYTGNKHLSAVEKQLVEVNLMMKEYKQEIDKMKQNNDILERTIGFRQNPNKSGGK